MIVEDTTSCKHGWGPCTAGRLSHSCKFDEGHESFHRCEVCGEIEVRPEDLAVAADELEQADPEAEKTQHEWDDMTEDEQDEARGLW